MKAYAIKTMHRERINIEDHALMLEEYKTAEITIEAITDSVSKACQIIEKAILDETEDYLGGSMRREETYSSCQCVKDGEFLITVYWLEGELGFGTVKRFEVQSI